VWEGAQRVLFGGEYNSRTGAKKLGIGKGGRHQHGVNPDLGKAGMIPRGGSKEEGHCRKMLINYQTLARAAGGGILHLREDA